MIHVIYMAAAMMIIQLYAMPMVMIDNKSDYRVSLQQIYGAVFMITLMILAENIMAPMPFTFNFICIVLLIVSYVGIRKQLFISDREYLKDMIQHHSMAVLTSRKRLEKSGDSTVLALAEGILRSQQSEITTMKNLTTTK